MSEEQLKPVDVSFAFSFNFDAGVYQSFIDSGEAFIFSKNGIRFLAVQHVAVGQAVTHMTTAKGRVVVFNMANLESVWIDQLDTPDAPTADIDVACMDEEADIEF